MTDHDHGQNPGHGHAHSHGNGHHHIHAPSTFERAFAIGIGLNLAFVVIEATYGFFANSMALLADAGHNLSDVFALVLAWAATALAKRPPRGRFTYGLRSSTQLAALFNALILLIVAGGIAWEAIDRIANPKPVTSVTIIVVAAVGIVINTATAMLFMRGHDDINIRGAFLHMAADAAVSAGVVLAGIAIMITGANWIDPAVSLIIVAMIVWSTWALFRESIILSMAGVPRNIDIDQVRIHLGSLPGVTSLHDLHIWPMSTTETALTCHLVMPQGHPGDQFLATTSNELNHRFKIHHTTLQIEIDETADCHLAPDSVV